MLILKRVHFAVAAYLLGTSVSMAGSEFDKLLANPQAFHGKHVTLTGIADIYDVGFFLYQRQLSPTKADTSRSVFVVGGAADTLPDRLNYHWLKVTGTVNARAHAPTGTEPCEILLTHYELADRPPLKEWRIFGVIKNDTSQTLKITVSDTTGYGTANVSPGSLFKNEISRKASLEVSTLSDQVIARRDLTSIKFDRVYFAPESHTLFFRVTMRGIEAVPAENGKRWLSEP
jgi:hypothetical protein